MLDPLHQGKGVGTLLFEKIKALSLQRNTLELLVRSSPEAELIYKHFGFKKIKKIYKKHPDGNKSFTILMKLSLV